MSQVDFLWFKKNLGTAPEIIDFFFFKEKLTQLLNQTGDEMSEFCEWSETFL